ncbi:MAG: cardiolipin synthase [Duncaniella sp.]|nr:cardiolipin synthase [Duncaniella sp.]
MILLALSSWLWPAVTVAYVVAILAVAWIIVTDNGNPVRSLGWIAVVVLLPVLGFVMYLFLGRGLKNTRVISRRKRRRLAATAEHAPAPRIIKSLSDDSMRLIRLGHATTGAAFFPDTPIEVYNDGESFFNALVADLRAARECINMQYYIFADDNIGTTIADILIEKAREGLKVRLLYDYVGCIDVPSKFFERMAEAGVEVEPFFKPAFPRLAGTLNWRNHRKGVMIDNVIGYIGGMNVADRYINGGESFGTWRDTSLKFTGSAVAGFQYHFAVDWNFMGRGLIDYTTEEAPEAWEGAVAGVGVQFITGGPTDRYSGIALTYFKAIAQAKKRVYIQTPYFLPNTAMLNALLTASLSGVDVRVMLPRMTDSKLLAYASRSYMSECMGAGIKFYLYEPGMLHCKVLVVDDEFSTIGTTNFDYRSMETNFEENVMMYSREMNRSITRRFEEDMRLSKRVAPREWHRRSRREKLRESVCRLLSPML